MYFEQIKINNGIPFSLIVANDETIKAMKDARNNKNMSEKSVDALKANLTQ